MCGSRDFIRWSLALGGMYDQCRLEKFISIVYIYTLYIYTIYIFIHRAVCIIVLFFLVDK